MLHYVSASKYKTSISRYQDHLFLKFMRKEL